MSEMSEDWGDFSAIIADLEQSEQQSELLESGETAQVDEASASDKSEAVAGMLTVAFVLAEQATSAISGVDFAFDDKGKEAVIEAAQPVIAKHGDSMMELFGDYIEEATLLIAVISLAWTSKRHVAQLVAEKEAAEVVESETTKPD